METIQTSKHAVRLWVDSLTAATVGVLLGVSLFSAIIQNDVSLQGVLLRDVEVRHACMFATPASTDAEFQSCVLAAVTTDTPVQDELHQAADESSSSAPLEQALPVIVQELPAVLPPPEASSSSSSIAEVVAPAVPEIVPEVPSAFPAFGRAVYPVGRIPNWGAMKTPQEWNRSFSEMTQDEYVALPAYDLAVLTKPLDSIMDNRDAPESIAALTSKLFYSTRFFGTYNPDSGEFTGKHAGIDLKLPLGTPIRSIGGGKVHAVRSTAEFGRHVIVEHRVDGQTYYAIYGHLGYVQVETGQVVQPGTGIGEVGMTGNTAAPHLHLQVDRGEPQEDAHIPYMPSSVPGRGEALQYAVNPIGFIASHR